MERGRSVNHLIYWPLDGALALPSFEWNKGCFWGMLSLRSHQTGQNNGRKVQYTRIFMPGKNTPTSKAGSLARNGRSTQKSERVRFSGHQTFVARNGWLEKGVRLIQDDPGGFLAADSVVRLGVGKNMVESIKYWCLQTGLIEDADEPATMRCTDLGRFLFGMESFPASIRFSKTTPSSGCCTTRWWPMHPFRLGA
jgi:hypothetical protein